MPPIVHAVQPALAIEGGRVTLVGDELIANPEVLPDITIQGRPARAVFASRRRLSIIVPSGLIDSGPAPVRIGAADHVAVLNVGVPIARGLHQVDNPVIDRFGNVYLTYSGTRGQEVPVSIFRVSPNGARETFSSAVVNPTSMALDREGRLYVSSRFEGVVYRLTEDGRAEPFATDLGVACGLAFAPDGTLYVGDRSGTIFLVDHAGKARAFATLPSSVAAFHLALGADALYVAAPTLSPHDAIYKVEFDGRVGVYSRRFGRPQGIAFNRRGTLCVVEALAGSSGLYLSAGDAEPELIVAGPGLIGVAFDANGGMVVCSNDTAYRFQNSEIRNLQ